MLQATPPALRRPSILARSRLAAPLLAVYAVALGTALALGSIHLAMRGDYPIGGVRAGAWVAWPRAGSRDADPYARAVIARRGDLPLAAGEGLALMASTDDGGRPLDAACTYRLGSTTPQARFWTLTVYDASGRPAAAGPRSGLTSAEILRDGDGRFTITLAKEARAGNWLPMPETGRVTLALRLYDTPVAAGGGALESSALPRIERVECPA
jgi:hypothetical protein